MTLFTIITVCKNDLINLKETVNSIKNQNYKNYEFIIIDGGSTDGSLNYVKNLKKVKYISEPDNGLYDAMNKGINICRGNYICFMNAGDTFFDKFVLSNIEKEIRKNPDIDLFYGDYICPKSPNYYVRQPKKITKFFLFRTSVCHQTWFLKRSIYEEINGFNINYKLSADYDVLLKIILKEKVSYLHIPLFVAKFKGGGVSSINSKAGKKENKIIHNEYFGKKDIFYYSLFSKILNIFKMILFYHKIKYFYNKNKTPLSKNNKKIKRN